MTNVELERIKVLNAKVDKTPAEVEELRVLVDKLVKEA